MKTRAHVFISGSVQGVFFRSETAYRAAELNLTGWVRNLPDGRVEAIFEGEEEPVREMVEFCKKGTRAARVTGINVSWEPYKDEFKNFQIRYGYKF